MTLAPTPEMNVVCLTSEVAPSVDRCSVPTGDSTQPVVLVPVSLNQSLVILADVKSHQLRLYALDFSAGQGFLQQDMLISMEGSASGKVLQVNKPLALSGPARLDSETYKVGAVEGFQSGCFLPLTSRQRVLGVLQLARLEAQPYA